jgi:hypothetical protein
VRVSQDQNIPQSPIQPTGEAIDLDALRKVRAPNGRFLAGVPGPRLTTGLRASTLLEQPALAEAHAEKVRAIEADLGAELSTLKRAAVTEAARLSVLVDSLGDDLMVNGVLTAKGRNRAALSAYVLTLDRLHKLMTMLGLERRSRSLPTTVSGIVAHLAEQERA